MSSRGFSEDLLFLLSTIGLVGVITISGFYTSSKGKQLYVECLEFANAEDCKELL